MRNHLEGMEAMKTNNKSTVVKAIIGTVLFTLTAAFVCFYFDSMDKPFMLDQGVHVFDVSSTHQKIKPNNLWESKSADINESSTKTHDKNDEEYFSMYVTENDIETFSVVGNAVLAALF